MLYHIYLLSIFCMVHFLLFLFFSFFTCSVVYSRLLLHISFLLLHFIFLLPILLLFFAFWRYILGIQYHVILSSYILYLSVSSFSSVFFFFCNFFFCFLFTSSFNSSSFPNFSSFLTTTIFLFFFFAYWSYVVLQLVQYHVIVSL